MHETAHKCSLSKGDYEYFVKKKNFYMVAMATAAILDFGLFIVTSKTQNFSIRFTQNLFYTVFRGSFTTDQSPFLDRYDLFEKKIFERITR